MTPNLYPDIVVSFRNLKNEMVMQFIKRDGVWYEKDLQTLRLTPWNGAGRFEGWNGHRRSSGFFAWAKELARFSCFKVRVTTPASHGRTTQRYAFVDAKPFTEHGPLHNVETAFRQARLNGGF